MNYLARDMATVNIRGKSKPKPTDQPAVFRFFAALDLLLSIIDCPAPYNDVANTNKAIVSYTQKAINILLSLMWFKSITQI